MRPVNLIPEDQQRARGGSRTGPLAYFVVGGLVLLLAGVIGLVLSSNQISERETELTSLDARKVAAEARADRLSPYNEFQQVQRERTTTVYELADSRFDWPRVLRQLSLVIPKYVVLGKLTGLAGQGISEGGEGGGESGSGGSDLAGEIKGPSLSMEGCAVNQKRVAALIVALHQIDGVTRVGLSSAQSPAAESEGAGGESKSGSDSGACAFVHFVIAVAFDAAPVSPDASVEATTAPVAEESPSESGSSESESSSAPEATTKTGADGSKTTISKTTTVNPPAN
jgi:Tfp pilus assembly protein PilN